MHGFIHAKAIEPFTKKDVLSSGQVLSNGKNFTDDSEFSIILTFLCSAKF